MCCLSQRTTEAGLKSCGIGTVYEVILLSRELCQEIVYIVNRADSKELASSFS